MLRKRLMASLDNVNTHVARLQQRRRHPRFDGASIILTLRPQRSLTAISGRALDFNRHGMAACTDQPLILNGAVYLSIRYGDVRIHDLVGVVHNCVRLTGGPGGGFRSGIRFRLASNLQRDRAAIEQALEWVEQDLEVKQGSCSGRHQGPGFVLEGQEPAHPVVEQ